MSRKEYDELKAELEQLRAEHKALDANALKAVSTLTKIVEMHNAAMTAQNQGVVELAKKVELTSLVADNTAMALAMHCGVTPELVSTPEQAEQFIRKNVETLRQAAEKPGEVQIDIVANAKKDSGLN